MKLRVVTINFQRNTLIQFGESIKTYKPGRGLQLIEVGYLDSYGKEHWIGILESDIKDTKQIKGSIEDLEEMKAEARLRWFHRRYPNASVIKIEASKLFDRLKKSKNTGDDQSASASIGSAFDLTWNK